MTKIIPSIKYIFPHDTATSTDAASVLHMNHNQLLSSSPGDIYQSCHWATLQTPEAEEDFP